jgi:hypothetical protein
MIDQQLIDENIDTLVAGLTTANSVDRRLHLVQSVFTQSMLTKLQEYFITNEHSDLWVPETTQYNIPMKDRPRHKITWDAETVIEELHEVCNGATNTVQKMYPGSIKPFNGVIIWRDCPGYYFGWHTDNPVINVSMQIYLQGSENNPGTEFEVENNSVIAPFIPNSGYIVDHSGDNKPRHRVTHAVPEGSVRYSLFALWGDRF